MDTLTMILSTIGVIGTFGTFYFGHKSILLEKKKKSLNWSQIESAMGELLRDSIHKFNPDAIVFLSGPSAIVANIGFVKLRYFIPTYLIMIEDSKKSPFTKKVNNYIEFSCSRWTLYLPSQLITKKNNRILIISDCVISGDTASSIKKLFIENGFKKNNLYYSTLVCSQVALDSNKAPDYYWYINPHADFYFPWGRWF